MESLRINAIETILLKLFHHSPLISNFIKTEYKLFKFQIYHQNAKKSVVSSNLATGHFRNYS